MKQVFKQSFPSFEDYVAYQTDTQREQEPEHSKVFPVLQVSRSPVAERKKKENENNRPMISRLTWGIFNFKFTTLRTRDHLLEKITQQ